MTLAAKAAYAVAHWTLDAASGNETDDVNSIVLFDSNSPGTTTGKFSGARTFDGSNKSLYAAGGNAIFPIGDVDFGVRFWFKLNSKSANQWILAKFNNDDENRVIEVLYDSGADRLIFGISADNTNFVTVTANNFGSPSTGVLYLLHGWHDATNNLIGISINAGSADTTSHSAGITTATGSAFLVGGRHDPGDLRSPFDGAVDDLVVMKGAFLDATERTADYNGGTGVAFSAWTGTPLTFDQAGNSTFQAASNDYTFNRTVAVQSNRILLFAVEMLAAGSVTAITDDNAGTPVAAVFVGSQGFISNLGKVEWWRVIAPVTGTAQVRVQLSATVGSVTCYQSWYNVHQTSPIEGGAGNNGVDAGAGTATVSITSVADQCVIIAGIATDDTAITSDQTERNNVSQALVGSGADESFGPQSPGAKTMGFSAVGVGKSWAVYGFALRPVGASGASINRTATDTTTYVESVSRVFAGLRTTTDAPTFAESLTRLQSLFRAPTDAPTYLDAATRAASLNKVAADAPTYLDVATRLFVGIRIAADAPIYSDAATRIGAFGRTASDSVTYSESCTRTGSFHPFTVDAATYSDVATRNGSFHKTATDACSYTESIGSIAGKNFTGTDAVSYSESISRQGTFSRAINDIASYLESVTRAASEVRASGDAVTYAEASTRIVATNRSTTEAESYATSVVTIATKMRSGTEALTYSDTATRIAILLRITTDGLTYSEVAIPDLGLIHGPRITDRFDFTMTVTDRDSFPGSVTDYVAFLE